MQSAVRFPTDFSMTVIADGKALSLACSAQKIEFDKPMEAFRPLPLEQYEKGSIFKDNSIENGKNNEP